MLHSIVWFGTISTPQPERIPCKAPKDGFSYIKRCLWELAPATGKGGWIRPWLARRNFCAIQAEAVPPVSGAARFYQSAVGKASHIRWMGCLFPQCHRKLINCQAKVHVTIMESYYPFGDTLRQSNGSHKTNRAGRKEKVHRGYLRYW